MKWTPTTLSNRVDELDLVRGFSLLGIFIANMLHFHTPYLYIDPYSYFTSSSDWMTLQFIKIYVEASFYPLFAIMFGYGLNMQFEKTQRLKTPFAPIMSKRLAILVLIGLIHAWLIWSGDILFTYALMGFVMIAAVRIPKKWLIPIASFIYIIPTSIMIIGLFLLERANPDALMTGYANYHQIERSISAYARGSFGEIFSFRFFEWLLFGLTNSMLALLIILPLIMFGAGLSKWKIIERASEMKVRLTIIALICIGLGVWLKSTPFHYGETMDYQMLQTLFGGPILGIGYAAALLVLYQLPIVKILLRPFTKAGRMSLTVYITQSIIATTIFYAYGFGLYGKVDLITGTWMAVGIFVIQVLLAEIWLMKFRMGPIEWVWRKLTYGKKIVKKDEKNEQLS